MTAADGPELRVLRVYHSGVVTSWRARERELARLGVDVTLLSAARWNEGGADVELTSDDPTVVGVRTFGTHPNLFLYDPVGVWRVLRSRTVDLLDVHEEPVSAAAAELQLLAWLAGRRVPSTLYSAQNIAKRYPVPFRWLERAALRRARGVHTCNDDAGRIVRDKGFRGVVRNLGLGVDVDRFSPGPTGADDPAILRVGYVGRLEARKGVHVLIDAVADTSNCSLVLVGDGPDHDAIARHVEARGLASQVTIRGYATHAELPELYRGFDVVVVPSLETSSWVEQFGRVVVEAMASGVPVVASRSGALPEVVGDAGVLVSPGDVGALTGALKELAADPDQRRRLAAAGLVRASQYSWRAVARRHLEFYRETLARAG